MKLINLNLFGAALLISCGTSEQLEKIESSTSVINPPVGVSEQNLNIFKVNNDQESHLTTKAGSVLHIPKDCFMYEDGTPISGDIELTFKEYHSEADIILSGIPMTVDSAGITEHFISGGMFSISGAQANRKVKIQKNKEIEVDLASISEQSEFPLWTLNEETGKWSFIENTSGVPTPAIAQMPKKPNGNYKKELGLNLNIPYRKFPELKKYKNLMWQLVHQKDTKKFKGTRLSIGSMIRSRKHGVYIIEIDTMGTKVEIEPIYTGPNLEKAINSYTTNLNKLKKDPNSIYYKPKMTRTIRVPNFTTYNCDVFARMTTRTEISLAPTIEGKPVESLYAIDVSKKGVLCFSGKQLERFTYDRNSNYLLIGVCGDQLGIITPENTKPLKSANLNDIVKLELELPLNHQASEENIRSLMLEYN